MKLRSWNLVALGILLPCLTCCAPTKPSAQDDASYAAELNRPPICEPESTEAPLCRNPIGCVIAAPFAVLGGAFSVLNSGLNKGTIVAEKGRCAYQGLTPAQRSAIFQQFADHTLNLNCKDPGCAKSLFLNFRERMISIYRARQWDLLTELIAEIGYPSDLSWYYLGRAAEEHGLYDSALIYYRGALLPYDSCRNYEITSYNGNNQQIKIDICQGLSFPNEIENRLSNLEARFKKRAIQ